MAFTVDISCPEIQQALDQISAYDGKTRLKIENAVSESVKNIAKLARDKAPKGKTGDLKKSIRSTFNKTNCTGQIKVMQWYAQFGAKANEAKHIRKRPPHPFMKPAFEEEKPELLRKIAEAVQP